MGRFDKFDFNKFIEIKMANSPYRLADKTRSKTVVFAIKYADGILVSGDKLISEASSLKTFDEPQTKIRQVGPSAVLAFSGAVYTAQLTLNIYRELLEIFTLTTGCSPSLDNQIKIFRNLAQNLAAGWLFNYTNFIFAGVDENRGKRVIIDFTEGCYLPKTKFAASGCGRDEAAAIIKEFLPLSREITVKEAIYIAIRVHRGAAEANLGISHPALIPPDIVLVDSSGVKLLLPQEIEEILQLNISKKNPKNKKKRGGKK